MKIIEASFTGDYAILTLGNGNVPIQGFVVLTDPAAVDKARAEKPTIIEFKAGNA